MVPRLVDFYRPERIYVFGSSARGDHQPHSDIDYMVLLADDAPDDLFRASHRLDCRDIPYDVQVMAWRVGNFDRRLHLKASFPSTIVREGRLLYERAAVAV